MADFTAAQQHLSSRTRSIFPAASARSGDFALLLWALDGHSLRDHLTATTRTKLPFSGAADSHTGNNHIYELINKTMQSECTLYSSEYA